MRILEVEEDALDITQLVPKDDIARHPLGNILTVRRFIMERFEVVTLNFF